MIPTFSTTPGAKNPGKPILDTEGDDLLRALAAPFHPGDVDWKPGGPAGGGYNHAYPYIDASALRRRLNEVCGVGGWQAVPYQLSDHQTAVALALWIRGHWVQKGDGAFTGDLDVTDGPSADEPGDERGNVPDDKQKRRERAKKLDAAAKDAKGAISNAFKRACLAWMMGDYLRDLGKVTARMESGYGKSFTAEEKGRLNGLSAEPYFRHHNRLAVGHERAAKAAFDKGELASAHGAAKAALRIRHEVFGDDHASTVQARAFLDVVEAKQRGENPPAAPQATPAAPVASAAPVAAPPSESQAPAVDLRALVQRIEAAGSADEVKAASGPGWKAWPADSDEGRAFRSAVEANMRRFIPGWTIAGAEAAKKAATSGTSPAPAGGAPPAARAPAGTTAPSSGKKQAPRRQGTSA